MNVPDIIYTRSASKFGEKAECMSSVAQNGKILAKSFGVSDVARSAVSTAIVKKFGGPVVVIPADYSFLCIVVNGKKITIFNHF